MTTFILSCSVNTLFSYLRCSTLSVTQGLHVNS